MKRNCRLFDLSDFIKENPELSNTNVEIWIDDDNCADILDVIFEKDATKKYIRRNKFKTILLIALTNRYDEDLYDRENVSEKAYDVTSMKFKGQGNYRIPCKEFKSNGKKIVMICCVTKKTQKNNKKMKTIYETVGGYEYEFKR